MKNKKPASKKAIRRGPGHHWDDLTPAQRSAIGQKAAETRRRNAALAASGGLKDRSEALASIEVLEGVALGTVAVSDAIKRSMVKAATSVLRSFVTPS